MYLADSDTRRQTQDRQDELDFVERVWQDVKPARGHHPSLEEIKSRGEDDGRRLQEGWARVDRLDAEDLSSTVQKANKAGQQVRARAARENTRTSYVWETTLLGSRGK